MKGTEFKQYTIDASGKILGRLATEVALLLRGKNKAEFVPYREANVKIIVVNVEKIKVSGKKFEEKKYIHHTLYPGGIKTVLYKDLFKKNPAEVLRRAVYGMLPKNKLRDQIIKRLEIK